MTSTDHPEHKQGIGAKIANVLKSPAVKKEEKVLAETVDGTHHHGHEGAATSSALPHHETAHLTDHEKAKLLLDERKEHAPNDDRILVGHKPTDTSHAFGPYYATNAHGAPTATGT